MKKTETPLVSICTPFFNSGKYIHRFLDSCLGQTYENIEIIVVDNASTDNGGEIVKKYALRDSRLKYFRNDKSMGITECLEKMFELAHGRFVVWPGADDWLARDFIENGVRSFSEHPEAAGIVPKVVTLAETNPDKFEFKNETNIPSKTYSREWYLRRSYKKPFTLTSLGLIRKEDALLLLGYFLKNYCNDMSLSEELRGWYLNKGYCIDIVFFLEILTRYKNFVWDNSLVYLKTINPGNVQFDENRYGSALGILKFYNYQIISHKRLFKFEFPGFYPGMKIFMGSEALSTAFIYFLRSGLRPSFLNIGECWKLMAELFGDFSIFEVSAVIAFSIPRTIYRFVDFMWRGLTKIGNNEDNNSAVFIGNNFLDSNGTFNALSSQ